MIATADEARLLFDKWQAGGPLLRVRVAHSSLILDAVGNVRAFTPAVLELEGAGWRCAIPLTDAGYSFSDPREVPVASIREQEFAAYEWGISLQLPGGDKITLLELKSEPAAQA